MVTFGQITSKTIRVNYVKDDIEGYKVVGSASYNKEQRLLLLTLLLSTRRSNEECAPHHIRWGAF